MIQPLREISAATSRLSSYISGAITHPLPPAVAEKGRQHILDTLAAMISGTQLRPGQLAIAYAATFLAVGVASDFRYVYWVVLAGLTCAVMTVLALQTSSAHFQKQDFSRPHPEEKA